MKTVKFEHYKHLSITLEWLKIRDTYIPEASEFPAIGYITYLEDVPVAVAFLRKVEGGFAQLDGLCTNPAVESTIRDKALDIVVTTILLAARDHGFKNVIAFTKDKNTRLRSQKHGFVELHEAAVIVHNLNSGDS